MYLPVFDDMFMCIVNPMPVQPKIFAQMSDTIYFNDSRYLGYLGYIGYNIK